MKKRILVAALVLLISVGVFSPLIASANMTVPAKPVNVYGLDGRPYYVPSGRTYNLINYTTSGAYKFNVGISKGYPLGYWHATLNGVPKAAYCLEFGTKVVRSGTAGSYGDYFENSLPPQVQEALTRVLLYGATLDNPMPKEAAGKFNRGDWLAATQALTWEFQQQVRSSTYPYGRQAGPYGLSSVYFYNLISGRSAEHAYDYMVRKIQTHTDTKNSQKLNLIIAKEKLKLIQFLFLM